MAITEDETSALAAVAKEPWDIAEFETAYTPSVTPPIQWSVEKYKVAQMLALSGKNKRQVAKELKLPLSIIEAWDRLPEFVDYKRQLVDDFAKAMKTDRLMVLQKILAARIDQAEADGYADLSRKDTVDIISELRKETGDEKTAEANYAGLLEKLVMHSIRNEKPIIKVEQGGGAE